VDDNLYLNKGHCGIGHQFGNAPRRCPACCRPRNNVDLSISKQVKTGGTTIARRGSIPERVRW
jgi:hypothetical protein